LLQADAIGKENRMESGSNTELWRTMFGAGHPLLLSYQRFNKRLPSPPRCKLCLAPFRGFGSIVMRWQGRTPSNRNPRYCSRCDSFIRAYPGGAEVEMSILFADVRGSTTLAESMSPTKFSELLNSFYKLTTSILFETDGFVIDLVGDEVVGLYPPGFSGKDHAKLAIRAAQLLLQAHYDVPIGIGVHTGIAYIGTMGGAENSIMDVRALGDNVNTTARLCSKASQGEALLSEAVCAQAGLVFDELEHRHVELKGKSEPVDVRVLYADSPVTVPDSARLI
jgi:adenylate cyclase